MPLLFIIAYYILFVKACIAGLQKIAYKKYLLLIIKNSVSDTTHLHRLLFTLHGQLLNVFGHWENKSEQTGAARCFLPCIAAIAQTGFIPAIPPQHSEIKS